ncbi:MAG: M1 family aminopeptidase [Planctomycetaceae bacterium]
MRSGIDTDFCMIGFPQSDYLLPRLIVLVIVSTITSVTAQEPAMVPETSVSPGVAVIRSRVQNPLPPAAVRIDSHNVDGRGCVAVALPEYVLHVELFPEQRRVDVQQQVCWTNPGTAATSELVFQVTANNRLSPEMISLGERTVESLRLEPENSIDYQGRRFHLLQATSSGQPVACSFDTHDDTHLHITLPRPVQPGEAVSINLLYRIDIPQIMGRLGQYRGVTNLLNWYPVLAVYRGDSWQPVPYIPWHQPWYNEAGRYDVTLRLPADHRVATGGHIVAASTDAGGWQTLQIHGDGLRDFTIVASPRFHELTSEANGIPIRVLYLPDDRTHAATLLKAAEESLLTFAEWFGPYAYRELEIVESHFGWNGNESSGLVMIDQRIMDLPAMAARYVDHLVSHEICHQWWYSAVGTDGYHEPWMDEGLVTWLTQVRMEDKYGKDAALLDLPGYGPFQFPNLRYRSFVHSGYENYRGRGGRAAALESLDDLGHLHNLMSVVYDRGARVTGMIQQRMGRDRFFEFMKLVYSRYRFDILTAADYQRELEDFTGESWQTFFETWLHGSHDSDWRLNNVAITKISDGYRTQVRVTQHGIASEPVDVEFSFDDGDRPFRLATLSETTSLQPADGTVVRRLAPDDWLVTVVSEHKPDQIIVDPDGAVIDSNPYNNRWRPECDVRWSPIYSPLDESSLMQPWQKQGLVGGFGVDSDGRMGLRASLIASSHYRISPFIAYTAATATRNDDHLSAGVDAIIYNLPAANWQMLGRYEYALLSTVANDPGHQARFALRKVNNYTTSFVYPNLSYVDFYARIGDNFFPDQDNTKSNNPDVQQYDDVRALGIDVHVDSQMPYWDPNRGLRLDANYEHGFQAFGDGAAYDRLSGQIGAVQRLDAADGWLAKTKLAARLAGGYGWDDAGEHFRFGGPGRFRGRNATATEGNAFWLTSAEWRFPLSGELDYEVLDNAAALHSVDGSFFYDVGRSYLLGEPQGKVDHAIGAGLYFQLPLLSFVENLTVRTEYGYSLTNSTGSFWFGLYRAF